MAVVESLDLLFHLPLLVLGIGDLKEWLHLGEQPPPGPVPQLQVALHIALDDSNGTELFHTLLVGPKRKTVQYSMCTCSCSVLIQAIFDCTMHLLPAHVSTAAGLELDNDLGQFQVSLLFQLSQHTSSKEYLGVADTIGRWVQVQCCHLHIRTVCNSCSTSVPHIHTLLTFQKT